MSKLNLTKELEQAIVDYYLFPHSAKETSSFFNISRTAVNTILKHHNIEKHSSEVLKELNIRNTKAGLEKTFGENYKEAIQKQKRQRRLSAVSKETQQAIIAFYLAPNSIRQTAKKFDLSKDLICDILEEAHIEKHDKATLNQIQSIAGKSEEKQEKTKKTNMEKYGVAYSFQSENNKTKAKATMLEKYGVEHYAQSEKGKAKIKETCLEKYGVDNYAKTEEFKDFLVETQNERLEKQRQTCIEKFGVDNYTKTDEFKEFMHDKMAECIDEAVEKTKQTCLEKYGVDCYFKSDGYKNNINEIQAKMNETKRINHSFNSSKPEGRYYEHLKSIFSEDDVVRQYRDDRYPFNCDFYIKSIDTFIELNLNWTHCDHKFNAASEEDLNILADWQEKAKTSDFYATAIEVWTIRDLDKFKAAEDNKLNYLVFYTEDEAINYEFNLKRD